MLDPAHSTLPVGRVRRTSAQVSDTWGGILQVLLADHPQSVRHVFYRMTDPRLPGYVEKTDAGYRIVQRAILEMRRAKGLPYRWIADSTRMGYHTATYANAAEWLSASFGMYRGNLWSQSPYHCEVWCESRSLAGVLRKDCEELAVSLYPAGGFVSDTLAYEAAVNLNSMWDIEPKDVVIYYVGDYDPAGVMIDVDIEKKMRMHLNPKMYMTFRRLGINKHQIEEFDLPTKLVKASERRMRHITMTVEAEAMPAADMRHLVRSAVESLLPAGALEVMKAAEESERAHLAVMANILSHKDDNR